MKKVIGLAILGVALMTSCSKAYTCKCTEPSGNGNKHIDLQAKNDSEAASKCAAEEGEAYGYVFTCEIQ